MDYEGHEREGRHQWMDRTEGTLAYDRGTSAGFKSHGSWHSLASQEARERCARDEQSQHDTTRLAKILQRTNVHPPVQVIRATAEDVTMHKYRLSQLHVSFVLPVLHFNAQHSTWVMSAAFRSVSINPVPSFLFVPFVLSPPIVSPQLARKPVRNPQ